MIVTVAFDLEITGIDEEQAKAIFINDLTPEFAVFTGFIDGDENRPYEIFINGWQLVE